MNERDEKDLCDRLDAWYAELWPIAVAGIAVLLAIGFFALGQVPTLG